MARRGACHIFEARGVSPVVGPDAELPLPTEDPFEQDPEACVVDRDLPGLRKLRAGKPNGAGALTLRLRDVDLADVFGILHEATGQGFVVSGDVRGRVSVDFQKIGLEEALDALAPTGIGVGAPGPIRLVRKSGGGAEAPPARGGELPVGQLQAQASRRASAADPDDRDRSALREPRAAGARSVR